MTSPNTDFTTILTTTLNKHRAELTDNIFKATPLADRLVRAGNRRDVDGGVKIVEPLLYAKNGTAKFYSGWEPLDLTPQDGLTAAAFDWKQFAVSVAINGLEEAQNSGDSQIISLIEAKVSQAEDSAVDAMATAWHATSAASSKAFSSINELIDDGGTVGNIDSTQSANAFWRSVVKDGTGDTTFAAVEKKWASAFYEASKGMDTPSFGLVGLAGYMDYEQSLMPQLRFTSNDSADARFRNLTYKGVPLFFDTYTTAGTIYFPNEKYLQLVTHSKKWMKNMGFRETPDVDGQWALLLSYGNLTIRNRARQAKVENCAFGSLTF